MNATELRELFWWAKEDSEAFRPGVYSCAACEGDMTEEAWVQHHKAALWDSIYLCGCDGLKDGFFLPPHESWKELWGVGSGD